VNETFKALSDPTRRRILELLAEKDMSSGEIAGCFDISKPSISHHMSVLKNAELVVSAKEGQSIIYSLNTTVLQDMMKWFMDFTKRGENDETESK
jgi:ArsR family transcriptional regulator, arsenate/arsenite/antimonite-responsive transcriptional repressor